ncbi:hypothetical protein [Parvibacter caecicola]|uniref:hypothetical protein n=1 Tax=Parvibacter caecicola TaxID=747645 RepID=UPI00249A0099|nr:hypothetical protein [Parvibacter caecicola]
MLNARKAWRDLCLAADLLDEETNQDNFRILWVSCITLARAIGHILDKNDGPSAKRISNELYTMWIEDPVEYALFTDFIDKDRNLLLKQYSFNYLDEGLFVVEDDLVIAPMDGDLYKPIASGRFAGWDSRDLLREVIQWWDLQLNSIETKLAS